MQYQIAQVMNARCSSFNPVSGSGSFNQKQWQNQLLKVRQSHTCLSFSGSLKPLSIMFNSSEDQSREFLILGESRVKRRTCRTAQALLQPVSAAAPLNPDPSLINEDLTPTSLKERSFSRWEMASLWIGVVVGVPSYYMAGSLVEMGMAWWQGIATVMAGNLLLLFPLILTGHPGTKYGISFPVLSRASFGIRGAHVPTILRGLVACGWFGIETWIGGQAILVLLNAVLKRKITGQFIPWLGTSVPEFACFLVFWFLQVVSMWNGMETIRKLENYSAPILIALSGALLLWAYVNAGGFGSMLISMSSQGEADAQFVGVQDQDRGETGRIGYQPDETAAAKSPIPYFRHVEEEGGEIVEKLCLSHVNPKSVDTVFPVKNGGETPQKASRLNKKATVVSVGCGCRPLCRKRKLNKEPEISSPPSVVMLCKSTDSNAGFRWEEEEGWHVVAKVSDEITMKVDGVR